LRGLLGSGLGLSLQHHDRRGLQSLRALHNVELHALALFQVAEALTLDGGIVYEDIFAAFAGDESVPLPGKKD
jgi:hypothetical protein